MGSIGLDVHPFTSTFRILDQNGKVVKIVTVRGGWKTGQSHLNRPGRGRR